MKYEGKKLNIIQEEEVVGAYFEDGFSLAIQGELDSFIEKKMEDTDNDFLMYDEAMMEEAIKYHKRAIEEIEKLQNRDFSTEKFKDEFYVEQM